MEDTSTGELRIRLFGDVSIDRAGEPVPLPAAKPLELLCYLLIHHERAHTREALAEVLWPGGHADTAKRYLRQALWKLNAALGARSVLVTEPDRVSVDLGAGWLDVHAFERAHAVTRDVPGQRLTDGQTAGVAAATELYRDHLLVNACYDWSEHERDRLLLGYLAMLEQLMDHCEAHRRFTAGMAHGQAVLRHDRARETTHRRLMRLSYRAGDRTSALRQYHRCAAVLADEFGVEPSAATVTLYRQICADRVPDTGQAPESGHARPRADTLAGVHARLDQIQASLVSIHESLRGEPAPRLARNGSAAT